MITAGLHVIKSNSQVEGRAIRIVDQVSGNTSRTPSMAVQVISGRRHGKAALGRCLMGMLVLNLLSVTPCHCKSATFQRLPYMDDYIIYTPPDNLDTLVARRTNFTSASQCAASCLTEDECSSFFYDAADGLCLMHSVVFLAADEAAAKLGTTYWQLSQDSCPLSEGFILYRPLGLCYKYHWQLAFWDEAESVCQAAGTALLKVDNQDKFQHLYNFLRGSKATRDKHVSIGASEKTGSYRWVDGSAVTWFNWATSEPSSSTEHCVTMAWFYYFKWNDVPCTANPSAKNNFLCQKLI